MKDRRIKKVCVFLSILIAAMVFTAGCGKEKADELTELELEQTGQDQTGTKGKKTEETVQEPDQAEKKPETESTVFVYVCGAVKTPGVYELAGGARVYEAIALAGGTREDAASESLNQARAVTDGERIYIPALEEVQKGIVDGEVPEVTGTDRKDEGKININTADKEDLKTLPGIGDAKADSIISYRESNGGFQAIEDLMNVEGIKEGVFNKIKDKITVTG